MTSEEGQNVIEQMQELVVNRRWRQSSTYCWRQKFCDQLINYTKEAEEKGAPLEFILGEGESIDDWVGMQPSNCLVTDGITEVRVFPSRKVKSKSERLYEKFDPDQWDLMEKEFNLREKHHSSDNKTIVSSFMKDLARKYQRITGKWLMSVAWSDADGIWKTLVQGLADGRFPDELGVLCVRIFGRETSKQNPHCQHKGQINANTMISVVTEDWTNEESTMKIAKICRGLGLEDQLMYKPQIYSDFRIFRCNVYDLMPTIYQID